jgi:hypothetical protein
MRAITKLTLSSLNYAYNIINGIVQHVTGMASAPGGLDTMKVQQEHCLNTRHIRMWRNKNPKVQYFTFLSAFTVSFVV